MPARALTYIWKNFEQVYKSGIRKNNALKQREVNAAYKSLHYCKPGRDGNYLRCSGVVPKRIV